MGESAADDSSADDKNDDGPSQAEAEIAAAVDEALEVEVKRQKARFVQEIMRLDRLEGVGRSEGEREDRARRRERDAETPDDSTD